jgi:hypothetical protein
MIPVPIFTSIPPLRDDSKPLFPRNYVLTPIYHIQTVHQVGSIERTAILNMSVMSPGYKMSEVHDCELQRISIAGIVGPEKTVAYEHDSN